MLLRINMRSILSISFFLVFVPPIFAGCGKQLIPNSRIIAGINAVRGSWPWQILFIKNRRPQCGGTIVSPRWIITAAHCITFTATKWYKIRVGEHDRNQTEDSEEEYEVSRIVKHPLYSGRSLNNDIAMLQLSRPIKFNKFVQPACLPSREPMVGEKCYITGWGMAGSIRGMTSILQQASLPVVSNNVCERLNKVTIPFVNTTNAMLCAGDGGRTRKSGCHGDSGGPFVCKIGDHWEIQGAVSHGSRKCDSSRAYTVFARIAYFKNWIIKNMAAYGR